MKKAKPIKKEKTTHQEKRGLNVIQNLSEFLLALDIQQEDTLKTMLVQFAVDSVKASRGSLLIFNETTNDLFYSNTFIYKKNRLDPIDHSEKLLKARYNIGENICGLSAQKSTPLMIKDVRKDKMYIKVCDEILHMKIKSLICIPIIVDNKVVAVLEIANESSKHAFNEKDFQILQIISNFASATLENGKLFSWAISDQLTKLYNLHYFKKQFEIELKRSIRYDRVFSLVMFDIDFFKQVNDNYGHLLGDEALRKVGELLVKNIREKIDIPARYGGDEFIILMPETPAKNAWILAERLRKGIERIEILQKDQKIKFTISCGIVDFKREFPLNSSQISDVNELIEAADIALYRAKAGGRNQTVIYANIPK